MYQLSPGQQRSAGLLIPAGIGKNVRPVDKKPDAFQIIGKPWQPVSVIG